MELRHLRYFVAVAEELNFRKASDRLRVAQPALSSQIQDLEAELNVRLLDRNTGGVRLTAAGSAFLAETRLTLAQAEKAARIAREAAAGIRGRVAIGYLGALSMDFIPATLAGFRKLYPHVELPMIQTWTFPEQMAGLESGELSVALAVRPEESLAPELRKMVIVRSEGRVALSPSHPLARKRSIRLAELADEPFITFGGKRQGGSPHAEIVKGVFDRVGVRLTKLQVVDGIEALRATVAAGLGVTLLADLAGVSRWPDLVLRKIADPGLDVGVQLWAFWRRDRETVALRNFLEMLAKVRRIAPPVWDGAGD